MNLNKIKMPAILCALHYMVVITITNLVHLHVSSVTSLKTPWRNWNPLHFTICSLIELQQWVPLKIENFEWISFYWWWWYIREHLVFRQRIFINFIYYLSVKERRIYNKLHECGVSHSADVSAFPFYNNNSKMIYVFVNAVLKINGPNWSY